jgi:hypothetical protein
MPQSSTESDTRSVLQRHYAQARQQAGAGLCLAVLHVGAHASGMAVAGGADTPVLQFLALGLERTAQEQFKTSPPTPLALENAIMVVEDVLMPLRPLIPREARLMGCDAALREVARVCGVDEQAVMVLSLDAMERGFNRLSRVVGGLPAAHEGLPTDNRFAMALLILRECMHHLQFSHITLLEQPAA